MLESILKDLVHVLHSLQENEKASAYGVITNDLKKQGKLTTEYTIKGKIGVDQFNKSK